MSSPKISIVIPSLNKGKFIGKTLQSIVTQSYRNFEVIIQDGGSTDNTLEIIKIYKKKYPNIIFWESKKDNGQLDAVNRGINKSSGEILAFINADDTYEKDSFASICRYYGEFPEALWFVGKGKIVNGDGKEILKVVTAYKNLLLNNINYRLLLITNFIMQPSVFITKESFHKYGPFTGTSEFITEYELWLKLLADKKPVVIKKYLSRFRIENSTKTMMIRNNILNEDLKIVCKYTDNKILIFLHKVHNSLRYIMAMVI